MLLFGVVLGYIGDYIIPLISHSRYGGRSIYYSFAVTIISSISLLSEFRMFLANSIAVFTVSFFYFFILRRIKNGFMYIIVMFFGLIITVFVTAFTAILIAVILEVDRDTIVNYL